MELFACYVKINQSLLLRKTFKHFYFIKLLFHLVDKLLVDKLQFNLINPWKPARLFQIYFSLKALKSFLISLDFQFPNFNLSKCFRDLFSEKFCTSCDITCKQTHTNYIPFSIKIVFFHSLQLSSLRFPNGPKASSQLSLHKLFTRQTFYWK